MNLSIFSPWILAFDLLSNLLALHPRSAPILQVRVSIDPATTNQLHNSPLSGLVVSDRQEPIISYHILVPGMSITMRMPVIY